MRADLQCELKPENTPAFSIQQAMRQCGHMAKPVQRLLSQFIFIPPLAHSTAQKSYKGCKAKMPSK